MKITSLMKKNGRAVRQAGFTLVELLIVIALIAILSVAVLATINPIEQTNKARDAQFKNDAAEVLGAFERYFASNNKYPWNVASVAVLPNLKYAIGSTDAHFGVVGAGGTGSGELVTSSELKSSFMGKAPFLSTVVDQDRMYVYHNGLDSNYVCFCPKATANRTGPKASELKCLMGNLGDPGNVNLYNIGQFGCDTLPAGGVINCSIGATADLICVPEGQVQ